MSNYHHGDLKNKLLEVGRRLLEESGADSLSMRSIALEAGVSHNAPYRHFKNKQQLLAAISKQGYAELTDSINEAIEKHPSDVIAQMKCSALKYVKKAVDYPELTELMFSGTLKMTDHPELKETAVEAYNALQHMIRQGIAEGMMRKTDTDSLTVAYWSALHGVAILLRGERYPNMELMQDVMEYTTHNVLDVLLKGMLAD